jgi:phosphatidylglycerol lysyltransferase
MASVAGGVPGRDGGPGRRMGELSESEAAREQPALLPLDRPGPPRLDMSRSPPPPGTSDRRNRAGWRRLGSRRHAAGLVVCVVAGLAFWGLERALADVSGAALIAALRATPASALLLAVAATGVSYLTLFGYDLSGLAYARARPPLLSALLASFCGYAIGNAVGFGALSGGAVRYRIYTAAGLSPGQVARVILFISVAIGIGLATVVAIGLAFCADRVSAILGTSPEPLRAAAGALLILAASFLAFLATRRRPMAIGRIRIEPPGPTLVLGQIAVTAADMLAAAAVLWVLLPPTGIGFFVFAAVFAAALALGVLSHVPGGLGIFELVILYAVGDKVPVSAVAAALVAYRGIYFLLPLSVSTILLAGFEARRFSAANFGRGWRAAFAGLAARRSRRRDRDQGRP